MVLQQEMQQESPSRPSTSAQAPRNHTQEDEVLVESLDGLRAMCPDLEFGHVVVGAS